MERFTYCLANQLVKDYNIKITLFIWDYPERVNWGKWDPNIEFKIVPYSKYHQKKLAKLFYWNWSLWNNPDAYLINFIYHGESILPKTSKLYYVLHSPAYLIPNRYKLISKLYNKFNNFTFISVSKFVKKTAEYYFNSEKNIVINHGLDFSMIDKKDCYNQNDKLKILTVAALESWKGIQDVIPLFKFDKIKQNFEYHIIGEGNYHSEIFKLIKKYDAENLVFLKGKKNEVETLYQKYDIYCQLSQGEAFGLSVIEAMGAGLPTIVYNTAPFDELFPSDELIKLDLNSKNQLKHELLDLLIADRRKMIGLKGQKYVLDTYTIEKMANKYYHLLNH